VSVVIAWSGVAACAAVVFLLGWICRGLIYEQQDNRRQVERDAAWDRAHLKESGDD
jgi:hypothetical protein